MEKAASGECLQSVFKKERSGDRGTEEAYRRAVQEDRGAEHLSSYFSISVNKFVEKSTISFLTE